MGGSPRRVTVTDGERGLTALGLQYSRVSQGEHVCSKLASEAFVFAALPATAGASWPSGRGKEESKAPGWEAARPPERLAVRSRAAHCPFQSHTELLLSSLCPTGVSPPSSLMSQGNAGRPLTVSRHLVGL